MDHYGHKEQKLSKSWTKVVEQKLLRVLIPEMTQNPSKYVKLSQSSKGLHKTQDMCLKVASEFPSFLSFYSGPYKIRVVGAESWVRNLSTILTQPSWADSVYSPGRLKSRCAIPLSLACWRTICYWRACTSGRRRLTSTTPWCSTSRPSTNFCRREIIPGTESWWSSLSLDAATCQPWGTTFIWTRMEMLKVVKELNDVFS